ncbi:MAG: diguanylate cyclase (GGDEF)-like protein/PAS domain S-box-containing protein [Candidatus Poriferisodalaceae bacterium]|jgi:diguanylate cyclase (GGDEF)-like protein/PAS domain S-box-containing protein
MSGQIKAHSSDRWRRWAPWLLLVFGLAFTTLVTSLRVGAAGQQRQSEMTEARQRFDGEVSGVTRSLGTEESKLVFLMESISGWSASMTATNAEGFDRFIDSLDLATKTPAITAVSVVERHDDGRIEVLKSSVPGVGVDQALLHTDVSNRLGMSDILAAADRGIDVTLGVPVDLHGMTEVGLARPVVAGADRFVVITFRSDVFLMPALLTGNEVQAMLIPENVDFPIIAPVDGTIAPRGGALPPLPDWAAEYVDQPISPDDLDTHQVRVDGETGARFVVGSPVAVFDQEWQLWVGSDHGFIHTGQSRDAWVIGLAGLLLSIAAFAVATELTRVAARQADSAQELRRSNRRFATGFENAPIGMAEVTSTGAFIRVNAAMTTLLGYSPAELADVSLFDLVHPDDQDTHARRISGVLDGSALASHTEVRYWSQDGKERVIDESISALEQEGDRHLLVQAKDVTRQREAEQELMRQALHDELTGLPNRALLFDRLRHALDTRLQGDELGVLFVDLDQFKIVNDSLGHTAGDRLLTVVADRILGCVGDGDTVARFGGDEFVVVCDGAKEQADVLRVARLILEAVKRPIELSGSAFQVTASIGATFALDKSATPESLLRDADSAMYRAKGTGRNKIEVFDDTLWIAAVQRLDLEASLRRAVENEEFTVHYQPVMSIEQGDIVSFEALVRWEHPERGLLRPDEFLRVAEEAGLLDEMDLATLRAACSQFASWSKRPGAEKWRLSVNCSPLWLRDLAMVDSLPSLLEETGLEPSRLCLEITERVLVEDADKAKGVIRRLHAMGICVAIDDFGTGYSSLSCLSQLSVDILKIDRSFVENIGQDTATDAIIAAVIEMATALNIPTVAEGVETMEQLQTLKLLGTTFAQGNLVSEPLDASDIEQALDRMVSQA